MTMSVLSLAATAGAASLRVGSSLNLAISLLFGVGQIAVGVALALRGLRHGSWRRAMLFTVALLGLWLACSGIAELIVSGFEVMSRAWGAAPAAIVAVRRAADGGLLVVSLALVAAFPLYLVWRRSVRSNDTSAPNERVNKPDGR